METLNELSLVLAPTIVAMLTVPVMRGIKFLITAVDGFPAWAQQIMTVLIAFGLSKLAALTGTVLPESLELFSGNDAEALVSAALAMAMHAGKKAKVASP